MFILYQSVSRFSFFFFPFLFLRFAFPSGRFPPSTSSAYFQSFIYSSARKVPWKCL